MLKNVFLCVISCSVTLLAVFFFVFINPQKIISFLSNDAQIEYALNSLPKNTGASPARLVGENLDNGISNVEVEIVKDGSEYRWKSNNNYKLVHFEVLQHGPQGIIKRRYFFISPEGHGFVSAWGYVGDFQPDLRVQNLHEYKFSSDGDVDLRRAYATIK